MSDVPRSPATLPALNIPKTYYVPTVVPHVVPAGVARLLVIAAVASGGSVILTRGDGSEVHLDEALLKAHLTADNTTTFACRLEYEFASFVAFGCTGFLVGV